MKLFQNYSTNMRSHEELGTPDFQLSQVCRVEGLDSANLQILLQWSAGSAGSAIASWMMCQPPNLSKDQLGLIFFAAIHDIESSS